MDAKRPISTQAEAMIRRVSPEGRALAERERQRRQRATARLFGRLALAAIVIVAIAWVVDVELLPIGTIGWFAAMLVFVAAAVGIGVLSKERLAASAQLAQSKLDDLPGRMELWVDQQRPLLPHQAVPLLDSISAQLADMAPLLAGLDAREPGADAVRRLLSTELPALVRGYQDVPVNLRSSSRDGGKSADAHLLHGLAVIDSEIGRMTEQLARGAFDELATQNRFLELKYDSDSGLGRT